MSKSDELRRSFGTNIAESIGARAGTEASPAPTPTDVAPKARGIKRDLDAVWIELDRVEPDPAQPRDKCEPEPLNRLVESFKIQGQLQPIRVRWEESRGVYLILCGERRWRAARLAGLTTIAAIIHKGELSPGEILAMQLVENCLREDLQPVQKAKAIKDLMAANNWTVTETARQLNRDKGTVSKTLSLLKLDPDFQAMIDTGQISAATGYEVAQAPEHMKGEMTAVALSGATRSETRAKRQQRHREKIEVKAGSVSLSLNDANAVESALSEALRLVRRRNRGAA